MKKGKFLCKNVGLPISTCLGCMALYAVVQNEIDALLQGVFACDSRILQSASEEKHILICYWLHGMFLWGSDIHSQLLEIRQCSHPHPHTSQALACSEEGSPFHRHYLHAQR